MSTAAGGGGELDLRERIARIDRAIAETAKLRAETGKLFEEGRKYRREWWAVLVTAAAAVLGAISCLRDTPGQRSLNRRAAWRERKHAP